MMADWACLQSRRFPHNLSVQRPGTRAPLVGSLERLEMSGRMKWSGESHVSLMSRVTRSVVTWEATMGTFGETTHIDHIHKPVEPRLRAYSTS